MQKRKILKQLCQLINGQLEGGFIVLQADVKIVAGVSEPANNCNGGYCVPSNNCGSGQNCGNCVTGCGSKE
ncbi:hypothetical protein Niako_0856 [Niastella koreensis GR20-10]|uniref:Uncharacterized protein n=1 Tax=Niastella koreensis (strain DSM 17620 / KACC 11465 / NBRC 106392 / GR20-10) TaxID=700598 RepID=G8TE44_NIAKG|nr:hypothetical protein [Niastella koreensis]AEV97235.1 hypothetical protein Niako_0856 [Niastella koreensis GR20-10]